MKALQLRLVLLTALSAQTPVFQSETRIVEIPVVARDSRKAPINDLRARDLHLSDNGVDQRILSLESFLLPNPAAAAGPTSGRAVSRLTIILLDALNTPLIDQINGQAAISGMLRKLAPDENRIAIYVLADGLRLLCNFMTDLNVLQSTLDTHWVEQLPIGAVSPPTLAATSRVQANPDPPQFADQRLSITVEAFRTLARRLKIIPGEKSLVWVTGGFAPSDSRGTLYDALRQLTAAQVRLYPIDARGLIACMPSQCPSLLAPIDMMEEVARKTGGRAYHDSNALADLALAALEDSSQGYLLTYAPNNYRRDGSAHRVELTTSRKGINLRYRPGYLADSQPR
jgi:VWFA-related protein